MRMIARADLWCAQALAIPFIVAAAPINAMQRGGMRETAGGSYHSRFAKMRDGKFAHGLLDTKPF
jgi:hypothetical protein